MDLWPGGEERKLTTVEKKLLTTEEPEDAGLRSMVGSPVGAYSLLKLLELLCCCWFELAHGCWCERELLNIASMEAGIVHDCHAAPSVVVSFMAETGDHNGDAEDFVDVALVHHASAELLLEDDLPFLSLLCDVGVALGAGLRRRSCCWNWVLRKTLLVLKLPMVGDVRGGWETQPPLPMAEEMMNASQKTNGEVCWQGWMLRAVSRLGSNKEEKHRGGRRRGTLSTERKIKVCDQVNEDKGAREE